jgi:D-glycero-alpha-D-manno-heptose-7-phosphate kinase
MVTIIRTPLRVSLFGGGTDYPSYFDRFPGAVLGFAIDKYIYISAIRLGASVDYRYRVSYSQLEHVDEIRDIQHPVVKAALCHYGYKEPLDISTQADVPASAGLGSSSAFTVGFVHLLSQMMGSPRSRLELAREAIFIERELLGENVGVQDQLHAAFGGVNRFDFFGDSYRISPINIPANEMNRLTGWFMLVFTGIKRRASDAVAEQIKNTAAKKIDTQLHSLLELVNEAQKVLESGLAVAGIARRVAELLDTTWKIKKELSSGVTLAAIDELYDFCIRNGALGGKLCGAGGGGFLLMVVPPEKRGALKQAVGERRCIDLCIDQHGSHLISGGTNRYNRDLPY